MTTKGIYFINTHFSQQVRVQDHQVSGHFCRNLYLVGLQLCVHAEQHVVGATVVTW